MRLLESNMTRLVCWGATFVLGGLATMPLAAQTEDEAAGPAPTTQIVQTQSFMVEYAIVGGWTRGMW